MVHPTDTLGMAAAGLVVAAAALTAFGLRQRRYEGWQHWVAALWLTALGLAASAVGTSPVAQALDTALLLQWPICALVGLRRFHPRQALPGRVWADWSLLAGASLLATGAALAGPGAQGLGAAAWLGLHLYVATVLFMGAFNSWQPC